MKNKTTVQIPDHMELEQPAFSGFVRYETTFTVPEKGGNDFENSGCF